MQRQYATFREVIDAFPSRANLAIQIGVMPSTVRLWHMRNSIPEGFWPHIVKAARRSNYPGVTRKLLGSLLRQTESITPTETDNGKEII